MRGGEARPRREKTICALAGGAERPTGASCLGSQAVADGLWVAQRATVYTRDEHERAGANGKEGHKEEDD